MNLFDTLESRRLMSVSLDAVSHVLTINGSSNADTITAKVVSGQLSASDGVTSKHFPVASVKSIKIFAGAGADKVTVDATVFLPTEIDTGTGAPAGGAGDQVNGGSGKDLIMVKGDFATVHGNGGDDTIANFGGINVITGDAGNDMIFVKRTGNPSSEAGYNGGTGTDLLDYSLSSVGLVIRNGQVGPYFAGTGNPPTVNGASADTVSNFENFTGGNGNDFIIGTSGVNILRGNAGADTISGLAGNDKLYGGANNDILDGGDNDDYLQGDSGNDFLKGGSGKDAMFGNDGNDNFNSKDGISDFLDGGAGTDAGTIDTLLDSKTSIEVFG